MTEVSTSPAEQKGFRAIRDSAGKETSERIGDIREATRQANRDTDTAETLRRQGEIAKAEAHEERAAVLTEVRADLIDDTVGGLRASQTPKPIIDAAARPYDAPPPPMPAKQKPSFGQSLRNLWPFGKK